MFLLVLLLVLLLLAITGLLWYRAKTERQWLLEMLYINHQQGQNPSTLAINDPNIERPSRATITPERTRRQVQLHHQSLHETLSQQLKEQQEQQTKRKRKKNQTDRQTFLFPDENSENHETVAAPDSKPQNTTEPTVISLDEATRLLRNHNTSRPELETVVLNLPTKTTSPIPTTIIEEITEDDPALRYVLRRQQKHNTATRPGKSPSRTRQTIRPTLPTGTKTTAPHPSGSPIAPQTINNDDIRSHLMRQRFAGRRSQKTIIPADNASVLPVIAEDEVRANLAKTDSPASRDPQRFTRPVIRESIIPAAARIGQSHLATVSPLSTRFTPFEHSTDTTTAYPKTTATGQPPHPSTKANTFDSLKIVPHTTAPVSIPTWDDTTENSTAFRTDTTLTEQVSTDTPHIELGDHSEWQQTLVEQNTPPEPKPVSATHIGRTTPAQSPTVPTPPTLPSNQATGYLKLSEYALPMAQLLAPPEYNPTAAMSEETLIENGITIEEKLAEFRVKVKVVDAHAGPVITRYEIEPDVGVRGSSVINLEKDLARSLGVAAIRVVETIPGKTCMGLELPNPKRQTIRLSEIFQSPEFEQSPSKITLALGQDITGRPVVTDLKKAPHLLVAGTTGSGKSVGVNAMILSMLFKASPQDVRLIMIDPKMLELSIYEGIPHLLAPVVTDMKLAANALTWCVNEMEKRYRLMSYVGVRNLESYNQKIQDTAAQGRNIANPFSYTPDDPEPLEKLPFIIVVVDEFADLMMVAGKQIEQLIARLAQKARAAGIHLILATQRPSVDVITGLIKANIPTRIAFQVSSKIDSRTILDQMGAENLLGQGDMLFLPPGTAYPQRIHGAFVADEEVHRIVQYLKRFGEPDYIDDILTAGTGSDDLFSNANSPNGTRDPQFDEAVAFILRSQKVTISSIQRHLRIGYNKAADIVEQMQAEGIVSAPDANGKRSILARGNHHDD